MAQVDTGGKKGAPFVDMTPMVDLGFLLITFFMLTTTMNSPKAMEINVPKPIDEEKDEQPELAESRVLTLVLGEDDKVFWFQGLTEPTVEETDYSAEGVRKLILKKNKEIAKMVVLIKPMKTSRYKNLVDILDEMRVCQIKQYALVDITEEDLALVQTEEANPVAEQQ